jgi:hypothetical protein
MGGDKAGDAQIAAAGNALRETNVSFVQRRGATDGMKSPAETGHSAHRQQAVHVAAIDESASKSRIAHRSTKFLQRRGIKTSAAVSCGCDCLLRTMHSF